MKEWLPSVSSGTKLRNIWYTSALTFYQHVNGLPSLILVWLWVIKKCGSIYSDTLKLYGSIFDKIYSLLLC
jgi:hypothetical protein